MTEGIGSLRRLEKKLLWLASWAIHGASRPRGNDHGLKVRDRSIQYRRRFFHLCLSSIDTDRISLASCHPSYGASTLTDRFIRLIPLRDGAQMIGADFTLAGKLAVAGMLDELGVDCIEAGYRCDRRAPVGVQADLVERTPKRKDTRSTMSACKFAYCKLGTSKRQI